jgi:hypothetical protein
MNGVEAMSGVAVVANAVEVARQHMNDEATDELGETGSVIVFCRSRPSRR